METPLFFEKQPFAVRLTSDEVNFCRENFDDLFDGDQTIQPRKAFMLIAEKSLAKIKRVSESQPADLTRIAELEKALAESELQRKTTNTQFNDLVALHTNLKEKHEKLTTDFEVLKANPGTTEIEKTVEVPVERQLLPTERLLQLTPLESFILAQIETVHKTDAKGILIDRFFNVYQKRGNGDFDILRISPSKYSEIVNHFKAQSNA
jgi:hypothetical protein